MEARIFTIRTKVGEVSFEEERRKDGRGLICFENQYKSYLENDLKNIGNLYRILHWIFEGGHLWSSALLQYFLKRIEVTMTCWLLWTRW